MNKPDNSPAHDHGRTIIEGATPHELLWTTAKLIASIAVALLAALWLDGLLSKF
jgi:hypothetical protein